MPKVSTENKKYLNRQIHAATLENRNILNETRALQKKMRQNSSAIHRCRIKLNKSIESIEHVEVSDHAVVRYLQRVYKLNLSNIKSEIATPELLKKVVERGDGTYSIGNFSVIVSDGVAVTILSQTHPKYKKKKSTYHTTHKLETEDISQDELSEMIDEYYEEEEINDVR